MAAALVAFAIAFDWNWLKQPIEQRVGQAIGRRLQIGGDLAAEWSLHPRVRIREVKLANPGWARDPEFLQAASVEFRLDGPALLAGRIRLDDVVLQRPVVALERAADGRRTWLFDLDQQDESSALHIEKLRVEDGELRFRDAIGKSDLRVRFTSDASADDSQALRFAAAGTLRGQRVDAKGTSTALLRLRDQSLPVPFTLEGTVGTTRVSLQGAVTGLERFAAADLRYDVRGASLKPLGPLFGVALPETPAYRVSGRLTHSGGRWETTDLKGKTGRSDVAGRVLVVQGAPRPRLEARLVSKLLDMADLGPLIGSGSGPARAPAETGDRVLPGASFEMKRIDSLDARVTIEAGEVRDAARLPLDNFFADFRLQGGKILIDPLRFGVAGGSLALRVEMEGRQPVAARVSGRVQGVQMARLLPDQAATGEAAGVLTGTLALQGRGNSVAAMLANADGRVVLLLSGGQVTSLWPALADLDGWRVLSNYLGGTRPEAVHCTVSDLELKAGVATPRVMLIDTETTVISVTGSANFADETIAARLTQAPKRPSLLSVRTPIDVTGTFRSPRVSLDKQGLIARAAGAVVLGLINPLASALALVEPGPGKDIGCEELLRDAQQQEVRRVARG